MSTRILFHFASGAPRSGHISDLIQSISLLTRASGSARLGFGEFSHLIQQSLFLSKQLALGRPCRLSHRSRRHRRESALLLPQQVPARSDGSIIVRADPASQQVGTNGSRFFFGKCSISLFLDRSAMNTQCSGKCLDRGKQALLEAAN